MQDPWPAQFLHSAEPNKVKTYRRPLPSNFFHTKLKKKSFKSIFQTNILMRQFFYQVQNKWKDWGGQCFYYAEWCQLLYIHCAWQRVFGPPANHKDSHHICRCLESIHHLIREIKDKARQLWRFPDWADCIWGCLCLIGGGSLTDCSIKTQQWKKVTKK